MPETKAHIDEHPEHSARNARSGFWLFLLYLLFYAGFMAIAAFAFRWLAWRPFGGTNLAILYGLALIIAAFVLAMIYMWFCKRNAEDLPPDLTKGSDI